MDTNFKTTKEEGDAGERLVEEYLMKQGFTIMERNWKASPQAKLEIDIIAMKDMLVIFVEVKARKGKYEDPIDAIDNKKIRNICQAADTFLRQQPYLYEYRFDIAGVTDPESDNPQLEYIPDAFLPPYGGR